MPYFTQLVKDNSRRDSLVYGTVTIGTPADVDEFFPRRDGK